MISPSDDILALAVNACAAFCEDHDVLPRQITELRVYLGHPQLNGRSMVAADLTRTTSLHVERSAA